MMLTSFLVNTAADSGAGSLRQAILDSNAAPGSNQIVFGIGSGLQIIVPVSALPSVTVPVMIDATSQPGYAGVPLIEIDGTSAGANATGLVFAASSGGSATRGLAIDDFGQNGISIAGAGNTVQSCYIGTNATGTAAGAHAMNLGILVTGANNTIGGTAGRTGNLISGNTSYGVEILNAAASGNLVVGNLIGTDITGSAAIANGNGMLIESPANTIGGIAAGDGNLISGNANIGIYLLNSAAADNVVAGNRIGTDVTGFTSLSNNIGVYVTGPDNTIGGTATGAGNVISGNANWGLAITAASASDNLVAGNLIGTDTTGTTRPATNQRYGVYVLVSGSGNTIGGTSAAARNVISGNTENGILIGAGPGSTDNVIMGNYIGTNDAGTTAIPNATGIDIQTPGNTVGGTAAGAGNLISGNTVGVEIVGATQTGTLVAGTFIGTNADGTASIGNRTYGVELNGAPGNTIGGTVAGAGNLISGNSTGYGVIIIGAAATGNLVAGNLIGSDVTGTTAVANGIGIVIEASGNTVGGTTGGAGNLISGNSSSYGVFVFGPTTTITGNVLVGNLIGTNDSGTAALANTYGIGLNNASGTTIGGTTAGAANVISGSTQIGVYINGAATSGNLVTGNFVGSNSAGTAAIANNIGIELTGAPNNTIGGTSEEAPAI